MKALNENLFSPLVLVLQRHGGRQPLDTDVRNVQVGFVILQEPGDGTNVLIEYWPRSVNDA